MSYALYRKYRSQTFGDIVGQKNIVKILQNTIKNNSLSHAYLLVGPRGTGKTSLARIFAKAINCIKEKDGEPCNVCTICKNITDGRAFDIIEIDAASHTGVDNIRDLKETVKIPPAETKYKVYIIDEVHMLSISAWNALLKTIEEPPRHTIFILATTETHKIPDTILSRCQRFNLQRHTIDEIMQKLKKITQEEKIKITREALNMIAIASNGGMRDAEVLLTQVSQSTKEKITGKIIEELLGYTRHETVHIFVQKIITEKTGDAFALIRSVAKDGHNLEIFTQSVIEYLRKIMFGTVHIDLLEQFKGELTDIHYQNLITLTSQTTTEKIMRYITFMNTARLELKVATIQELPLELSVLKSVNWRHTEEQEENNILSTTQLHDSDIIVNKLKNTTNITHTNTDVQSRSLSDTHTHTDNTTQQNDPIEKKKFITPELSTIQKRWDDIVNTASEKNNVLKMLLANSILKSSHNGVLTIAVAYEFYKEKLSEPKIQLTVMEAIDKIVNVPLKIKIVTEVNTVKVDTSGEEIKKKSGGLVDDAVEIMGGTIVNE